jgi:hypothetical protein
MLLCTYLNWCIKHLQQVSGSSCYDFQRLGERKLQLSQFTHNSPVYELCCYGEENEQVLFQAIYIYMNQKLRH